MTAVIFYGYWNCIGRSFTMLSLIEPLVTIRTFHLFRAFAFQFQALPFHVSFFKMHAFHVETTIPSLYCVHSSASYMARFISYYRRYLSVVIGWRWGPIAWIILWAFMLATRAGTKLKYSLPFLTFKSLLFFICALVSRCGAGRSLI